MPCITQRRRRRWRRLLCNAASFSRKLRLGGGGDEIFMAAVVCGLRGPRETFPLFYGANIHFPHRPGRAGRREGERGAGPSGGGRRNSFSLLMHKCSCRRRKSPDVMAEGRNNGYQILEERHKKKKVCKRAVKVIWTTGEGCKKKKSLIIFHSIWNISLLVTPGCGGTGRKAAPALW